MTEQRTIAPMEDPVCGMTVDPAQAREKGLALTYSWCTASQRRIAPP